MCRDDFLLRREVGLRGGTFTLTKRRDQIKWIFTLARDILLRLTGKRKEKLLGDSSNEKKNRYTKRMKEILISYDDKTTNPRKIRQWS